MTKLKSLINRSFSAIVLSLIIISFLTGLIIGYNVIKEQLCSSIEFYHSGSLAIKECKDVKL